jgi:hypothetical protein
MLIRNSGLSDLRQRRKCVQEDQTLIEDDYLNIDVLTVSRLPEEPSARYEVVRMFEDVAIGKLVGGGGPITAAPWYLLVKANDERTALLQYEAVLARVRADGDESPVAIFRGTNIIKQDKPHG